MDVFALDPAAAANEGAVLELRNPDGSAMLNGEQPVTIRLLGTDSDAYTQASNALTDRAMRNRGRQVLTAAGLLTDQINLLAKVTVGWWGLEKDGEPFPFTEDNAKALYRVAFIREQVEAFIADRGNFSKASPTT
jgi:hypothetical protein